MKHSMKSVIIILFSALILIILIFRIINGKTTNIGEWYDTPQEALSQSLNDDTKIIHQISIEYIGENGCDGAIILFTEQRENIDEQLFSATYLKAKKNANSYVYAASETLSFRTESLNNISMSEGLIQATSANGYITAITTLSSDEIRRIHPIFSTASITPTTFSINENKYTLNFVKCYVSTSAEASSIAGLLL